MANKYEIISDNILKTAGSGAGLYAAVNSAFVPGVPNANIGASDWRDAGINLYNSAVSLLQGEAKGQGSQGSGLASKHSF